MIFHQFLLISQFVRKMKLKPSLEAGLYCLLKCLKGHDNLNIYGLNKKYKCTEVQATAPITTRVLQQAAPPPPQIYIRFYK
jgi:hypothetical protein